MPYGAKVVIWKKNFVVLSVVTFLHMPESPLFSIILTTYNREALLRRSVLSVIAQTVGDWELLVLDDGSTDGTSAYMANLTDARVRYVSLPHGERSRARNTGIRMATGKYICFLDDDDEYKPGFLSAFYDYYVKHNFPNEITRVGYCRVKAGKSKNMPLYHPARHGNPVRFAAFHMCGVWTLCVPAVFLQEDYFHPDFPHWQDTHLILRLVARHGMVQLPGFYYMYHIHKDMGSVKMANDIEQKLAVNLQPIHHLFENYSALIQPFLPAYTRDFLVAKKYLEFAQVALQDGRINLFWKWLKISWQTHMSVRFWRHYGVIVRDWMKRI